ncbi:MAG TPA: hypothetical protein VFH50_07800 [Acidimicrobiales bacterium]|nr:hypothetical protein [Acidimicrobiales bacterium]
MDDLDDLDDLDGELEEGAGGRTALPPRVEAWRRRTATGALLTGMVRGFGEVFEPERDQPAIVAEAPGEPLGPPRPLEAVLDPDDPSASSLVVRRWLMEGADPDPAPGNGAGSPRSGS